MLNAFRYPRFQNLTKKLVTSSKLMEVFNVFYENVAMTKREGE
ncbi:hypothetical protein X798_05570 [Onchocerca flexuosa]|uniref:Uncharacterized protein n=1 Tax=Onchocerca flexuosa TaxID=387005 RepID=A0A238BQ65_9BILA|nr:hypothetical protein X798_05570 [Onchocerca flexuosa]